MTTCFKVKKDTLPHKDLSLKIEISVDEGARNIRMKFDGKTNHRSKTATLQRSRSVMIGGVEYAEDCLYQEDLHRFWRVKLALRYIDNLE